MTSIEELNNILSRYPNLSVLGKDNNKFNLSLLRFNELAKFELSEEDIGDYFSINNTIRMERETEIFTTGYYEHAIRLLEDRPTLSNHRLFGIREERKLLLHNQDSTVSIEISPISMKLVLTILEKSPADQLEIFFRRIRPMNIGRTEVKNFIDLFQRFLSIKVSASNSYKYKDDKKHLYAIAESSLFNITYNKGISFEFSKSWQYRLLRLRKKASPEIQFPQRTYNAELLAYYQLAVSSSSVILAYILYYNILEYLFPSSNDAILRKRLTETLIKPDFHYSQPKKLNELVNVVRRFDRKSNEGKMLDTVLEQYFMPDEIVDWVTEYETNEGQHYTSKQKILGLETKLDLNPQGIYSSLSQRIYHVRNVLVHNKEGIKEDEQEKRFIPFSGQDEIIAKELPILIWLAEQLILKTGQTL